MQTGENEESLRKILDMTRLISVVLLVLHFYYFCYLAFEQWNLTLAFTYRLMADVRSTGLFNSFHSSKLFALVFLFTSLLGARGKMNHKLQIKTVILYLVSGLLMYFLSYFILLCNFTDTVAASLYMFVTITGFILIIYGGTLLSRVVKIRLKAGDIFNKESETFPQEERLLTNDYSINLPSEYYFKGKKHKSWINIINPFRALMVLGSPGSGKSYFVIRHVITQHIRKGFTMFVYDFKFDDLSKIVYNTWLKHKNNYKVMPQFYVINFDDLTRSHRS